MRGRPWHTEWIVTEVYAATRLVPLIKRKVDNPAERDYVRVFQFEVRRKFTPQTPKN